MSVLEEMGDTMPYRRPGSNGRVITSKCLQGACLKGVGKGGAFQQLRTKQGGATLGRSSAGAPCSDRRGPAEPETLLHPVLLPPPSPGLLPLQLPCNN